MKQKEDSKTKEINQNSSIKHKIDAIDRQILNILAKNGRAKLTQIAKDIKLSVVSTKKRVDKLEKSVIKRYTIQTDDKMLGINTGVHIYTKLKDITRDRYDEFIAKLVKNPKVIDVITVIGDYDIYIVMIAKDREEMEDMKLKIRQDFSDIIADWKEVIVARVHKLEEYSF
ncbi:MAG: AsnC family transcriptional regulator [Candidatus Aenigmarchaeota archaeon]|nr:AsnC family transcriptional regulator [Candidatus Aenigmarchaeota archaeon]